MPKEPETIVPAEKPTAVAVVAILQTLVAITFFAIWVVTAFWGASRLGSLLIASLFFGIPLCVSIAAAWGLWHRNRLGWPLSLLCNSAVLIFLAWTSFVEPLAFRVALGVVLVSALALLLSGSVRCFYRR